MPSIERITDREHLAEEHRQHYDAIVASRGVVGPPYYYLLHQPELAARTAHLLGYARFESALPADVKELAVCTVAREMDCLYEWAAHKDDALASGVSPEAVAAVEERGDLQRLSKGEAAIVEFVRELLRPPHRISGAPFEEVRSSLGDSLVAELVGVVGAYAALACSLNAFDVQPPEGRPVLPT